MEQLGYNINEKELILSGNSKHLVNTQYNKFSLWQAAHYQQPNDKIQDDLVKIINSHNTYIDIFSGKVINVDNRKELFTGQYITKFLEFIKSKEKITVEDIKLFTEYSYKFNLFWRHINETFLLQDCNLNNALDLYLIEFINIVSNTTLTLNNKMIELMNLLNLNIDYLKYNSKKYNQIKQILIDTGKL